MKRKLCSLVFAIAVLCGSLCQGSVLVFERSPTQFANGEAIPQTYGDNITTSPDGNGFVYGAAGGITPNITATYFGLATHWGPDYGDLSNVAYGAEAGGNGIFGITLTADPGYNVVLKEFFLAGWNHADYDINSVRILDGANNVLLNLSTHIEGDANGPQHTVYSPNIQGQVLTIEIDAANLGGNRDNIGIDNVQFSQVTPEPTSIAIWSLSAVGLCLMRRRRKALAA